MMEFLGDLGLIAAGAIIGFLTTLFSSYLTDKRNAERERERRAEDRKERLRVEGKSNLDRAYELIGSLIGDIELKAQYGLDYDGDQEVDELEGIAWLLANESVRSAVSDTVRILRRSQYLKDFPGGPVSGERGEFLLLGRTRRIVAAELRGDTIQADDLKYVRERAEFVRHAAQLAAKRRREGRREQ